MEVTEKCLNSELWHAYASGMVQMPTVNSKVFYFPQGHEEHTLTTVDFGATGLKIYLKRLNAPKHWMLDKLGGAFSLGTFIMDWDEGKKLSDELLSTKDYAHMYAELTKIDVHIQR